jgi:DNA-binding NarL/FixJ family response regulator
MIEPISVLVADDHALMREGLVELLKKYTDITVVATAANGREAVQLAREHRPQVAIFDISMPELNGIDATRELAQQAPGVRVLILSMHAGAQHIMQALAAGAHGYLLKQSASEEVAGAVRAVAAGRRYLSPEVSGVLVKQRGRPPAVGLLETLSSRERQIMQLVAEGRSSTAIGLDLHLSPKTVDTYRSRLMQKLRVKDVSALIKLAILHGLTPLE